MVTNKGTVCVMEPEVADTVTVDVVGLGVLVLPQLARSVTPREKVASAIRKSLEPRRFFQPK